MNWPVAPSKALGTRETFPTVSAISLKCRKTIKFESKIMLLYRIVYYLEIPSTYIVV